MKEITTDYIIVGLGFAGMAFSHILEKQNKSFMVFSSGLPKATTTAAALFNPVILKRFTPVWKAQEQMVLLSDFYKEIQEKLGTQIMTTLPVYRKFASLEEQNNWFVASDKASLKPFLSTSIKQKLNPHIETPFGVGEVLYTGRIFTEVLAPSYHNYLQTKKWLKQEQFIYSNLEILPNGVKYGNVRAKRIVFCEGYEMVNNPYFNYLPLMGCKGELLEFQSEELKEKAVVKSDGFVIAAGQDTYHIGATYDNFDKTPTPTLQARETLEAKLQKIISCNYRIIGQRAAVRPTTSDRRPLVGQHPSYKNIYVLNGLGTRGAMLAPYTALALYAHIEENEPIDGEMNIERFANKYPDTKLNI